MNEFRTTKVSFYNDSVLQKIRVVRSEGGRSLRGLLWDVERAAFVSRDLNAALNIRRCCIAARPEILDPSLADGPLQQVIVKTIKCRS